MKKIFLSLTTLFAFVTGSNAQNTSPYWSLAGNSNATSSSKLGTTNAIDLKLFTNNTEKMRITTSGVVSIGTIAPNASAKLDIKSITKGLLIPRMTQTQRNAIPSPATGLLIFQTDNTPGFYYYGGSAWTALKGSNTSLSNLVSPTSINQVLLPNVTNSLDIGSFSLGWRNIFASRSYYLAGSKVVDVTGTGNTFLGNTGNTANTGTYNTFVGNSAGISNTSGGDNIALGAFALRSTLGGTGNLAVGKSSLYNNTSGSSNTAVGNYALIGNTLNQNTGVGYFALANTSGAEGNTAIGFQSGQPNNNGYYNCFIGSETTTNAPGYYNVIAIGHGTIATAPSQVTIGNTATSSYRIYGTWANISDGRYKKNIKENVPGLAFINKLRPVTYNLDATGLDNFLNKNRNDKGYLSADGKAFMDKALKEKEKIVQTGFVAQEVEKSAHELGYDFSGVDVAKNDKDVYGLRYAEFVVPLVKAVQELSSQNDELKKTNDYLQKEIDDLKAMIHAPQSTDISSASLEQNTPNPFTKSTIINYTLPREYKNAKILIVDKSGRSIKEIFVNGEGQGSVKVDTSMLAAGTYTYSLYVNGKLISTKQMVNTK